MLLLVVASPQSAVTLGLERTQGEETTDEYCELVGSCLCYGVTSTYVYSIEVIEEVIS